MKHWFPLIVALAGFGCVLPNCAVVPETGRRQMISMTPQEESQLGLQAFQEYKKQKPVSSNAALAARIRRVGQRLSAVANVPGAQWEFVLFADDEPNAFAVPGGKVGVNTGIMSLAQTDAGLATIIGHEIAHLTARHAAERVSQKRIAEIGASVVGMVLPESGLLTTGVGYGAQLGLLKFSRSHELEADQIGSILMARAGYDPREAVAFWQRFADYKRQKGQSSNLEFLSTHPLDDRRINDLRAFLPRALADYRG